MDSESEEKTEIERVNLRLNALERRVVQLESELGITPAMFDEEEETVLLINKSGEQGELADTGVSFESRIGGYGLALLGSIVFLFGIIFLTQYIHNNGFPIASSLFGYIATGSILLFSHYVKKKVPHLSAMFNVIGQFLLYYITLRLHFFIDNPVISNKSVDLILIFIVVLIQLILAYKRKSELFAGIAIVLTLVTGFISDNAFVMLFLSTFISAVSILLFYKFEWRRVFGLSVFIVYLNFIAWFLKNPLSVLAQNGYDQYCFYFLLASAAILSLICLIAKKEQLAKNYILGAVLTNGINFSLVLALFVMSYMGESYTILFVFISAYCLAYSIVLKSRSEWEFTPALYALYGFVAMSVAIYGYYKLPYSFLFSSMQSLLVLVYAIWFRSKIIVTMNTILFVILFIAYVLNSGVQDSINISFSCAAFISTIVIDKKKQLMKIDSMLLSNVYLVAFFFIILFTLYKLLPPQYITLSWSLTAILYFIFSIFSRNVKFRWMAIFTMISAALYLFLVDLSRISLAYRIVAFLVLAMISIGISLYYTKVRKGGDAEDDTAEDSN